MIDFEELSALLDGELAPARAAEVRAAVAADPALEAEFQALCRLDERCRAAADAAAFVPAIGFPVAPEPAPSLVPAMLVGGALALSHGAVRLVDSLGVAYGLQGAALLLALLLLVRSAAPTPHPLG